MHIQRLQTASMTKHQHRRDLEIFALDVLRSHKYSESPSSGVESFRGGVLHTGEMQLCREHELYQPCNIGVMENSRRAPFRRNYRRQTIKGEGNNGENLIANAEVSFSLFPPLIRRNHKFLCALPGSAASVPLGVFFSFLDTMIASRSLFPSSTVTDCRPNPGP